MGYYTALRRKEKYHNVQTWNEHWDLTLSGKEEC